MALILASASPRRQELLRLITTDFITCPSDLEESTVTAPTPAELVQALAVAKCRSVAAAQEHPAQNTVIGCDTVVDCGGTVFGKPADEAAARAMLQALSGRRHLVHTGLCVRRGETERACVESTVVEFAPIAPADLDAYIKTAEPYDKAGGYAIQGHAALWCRRIEGCYYTIMGLPVHRLAELLAEF